MSREVFIALRRSDIPNGVLQVLDLKPNSGSREFPYTSRNGQTKYVRRVQNDTVATTGAGPITTTREFSGLAAYLLDNVESGGLAAGVLALTATQANTVATNIIARMDAGQSMTLADINALLNTTVADTELTSAGGSASQGVLEEVLRILAGAEYVLPAASAVENVGNVKTARLGSFTSTDYRKTFEDGSFILSLDSGHLSGFTSSTFDPGAGLSAGAAMVCWDASGNALPRANTQVGGFEAMGGVRVFTVTVDEADLTTAGNAHNVDVTGFPGNVEILGSALKLNETFAAGAGVTQANVIVGEAGADTDELVATVNLFGATPGWITTTPGAGTLHPRMDTAYNLRITVSGAGAENVTNYTTGNFTVKIFYLDLNNM